MQQTPTRHDLHARHTRAKVGHITTLAQSFRRSLLSENKAPRTVEVYGDAVRLLAEFLDRVGMPTSVDSIRREHVEAQSVLEALAGLNSADDFGMGNR